MKFLTFFLAVLFGFLSPSFSANKARKLQLQSENGITYFKTTDHDTIQITSADTLFLYGDSVNSRGFSTSDLYYKRELALGKGSGKVGVGERFPKQVCLEAFINPGGAADSLEVTRRMATGATDTAFAAAGSPTGYTTSISTKRWFLNSWNFVPNTYWIFKVALQSATDTVSVKNIRVFPCE